MSTKDRIKQFFYRMNLLTEKEDKKHEYNCVMLYFEFPLMKEIHSKIKEEDIYTDPDDDSFGLEDEPHITLLFGLHENVSTEDVKKVVEKFSFSKCKIHNPSLFTPKEYDVFKFDVEGENLHECNDALKEYPYTSDFPNYHPHLTIGYLKSGKGEKYVNMLKGKEYDLIPTSVVYSKTDGTKDTINLK
jgi:2'-5' RNA ligase